METQPLGGGFSDPPMDSARAFRAALEAMARPGTIRRIEGARAPAPLSSAAATLLLMLCDGGTPLHLAPGHDGADVRAWVTFHTGAPLVGRGAARFAVGGWPALGALDEYAQGTADYPDRSATLIVECAALRPEGARLTGPGIRDATHLSLPGIAGFRSNAARFPLGLDFFFTAGAQLAALPRTTQVEAG
ncbi:carbon-phosphorus lyase [Defluviimonas sp. 20V17]|uniref:Alpha-D-ribose 1-methylphosphonate 5-triphosphate synthase subunit PhnH n=1 Tax=Allgaiera indica TaxID=765699 RepID=A0AAN4UQT7_9RHOB|nr:phosphonate C-P lyase system protein PhnH [Allgaiera indica]KDB02782.1 carbon-phosphorus lyase [Defluviimonas sp. 20V17]GHE01188.1 carbon-phosphorus lyase subunit PhnH [Allgaiera indica]SDW82317.1 alpha-D-ribose 1-methylphosphonate 5-triphosphate synthase subunit PhnH [Allgaiera indica]